jgi:hypothetical protein
VSAVVDYQVLCENVAGTARIGNVPVTGEAARRLACDAGVCRIIVQIHHTNPWTNHGSTDLHAGIPLCWGHHDLVHEGGWTVNYHGPTSTITFTTPDGRHINAPVKPRLDRLFAA